MSGETGRYALYFAPNPASAIWRFGSRTIGYDAATSEAFPPAAPAGLAAIDWAEATADPRKYGFHATLKAPFVLLQEKSEAELIDAVELFARQTAPVPEFALEVRALGAFIALVPKAANAALQDFAFRVVRDFEPYRAPLSSADRVRRLASPFTERQISLLDRYGYPYVDEQFRFHMTLTGKLAAEEVEPVRAALAAAWASATSESATSVDAIAVYHQKDRAAPFRIIARFALNGQKAA